MKIIPGLKDPADGPLQPGEQKLPLSLQRLSDGSQPLVPGWCQLDHRSAVRDVLTRLQSG